MSRNLMEYLSSNVGRALCTTMLGTMFQNRKLKPPKNVLSENSTNEKVLEMEVEVSVFYSQ